MGWIHISFSDTNIPTTVGVNNQLTKSFKIKDSLSVIWWQIVS